MTKGQRQDFNPTLVQLEAAMSAMSAMSPNYFNPTLVQLEAVVLADLLREAF